MRNSQVAEPKPRVRIGPPNTVGGVVVEMGRVYRQARRSDVDMMETGRLVNMPTQMVDNGMTLCGGCQKAEHAQAA